jgi:hypothetical protein
MPSLARTSRGYRAASAPGKRAMSPCRGPFSPLDRAARPRTMQLFDQPRVAGRRIAQAVSRADLRPNIVRDLKFVSELFNWQKLFHDLKINRDS